MSAFNHPTARLAVNGPLSAPAASCAVEVPCNLAPMHSPLGAGATERLRAVHHIEIRDIRQIDGVKYYVLDVYAKELPERESTMRLSLFSPMELRLTTSTANEDCGYRLSYRVIKRYAEFEGLRKALQQYCGISGHARQCTYCSAFSTFLGRSGSQPGRTLRWTKTPSQRSAVLERFVNQTIDLALDIKGTYPPQNQDLCATQRLGPQLVEEFLRSRAEKTLRNSIA